MKNTTPLSKSKKPVVTTDPENTNPKAKNPSALERRRFLKLGASGLATTLTGCVMTKNSSEPSLPEGDEAIGQPSDQDQSLVQDQPDSGSGGNQEVPAVGDLVNPTNG